VLDIGTFVRPTGAWNPQWPRHGQRPIVRTPAANFVFVAAAWRLYRLDTGRAPGQVHTGNDPDILHVPLQQSPLLKQAPPAATHPQWPKPLQKLLQQSLFLRQLLVVSLMHPQIPMKESQTPLQQSLSPPGQPSPSA
jgi:hypothetical protein